MFWQPRGGAGPVAFLNSLRCSCSARGVGIFNLNKGLVEITISKGTSSLVFAVICQLCNAERAATSKGLVSWHGVPRAMGSTTARPHSQDVGLGPCSLVILVFQTKPDGVGGWKMQMVERRNWKTVLAFSSLRCNAIASCRPPEPRWGRCRGHLGWSNPCHCGWSWVPLSHPADKTSFSPGWGEAD